MNDSIIFAKEIITALVITLPLCLLFLIPTIIHIIKTKRNARQQAEQQKKSDARCARIHAEQTRWLSHPPGVILTRAYMISCWTEEVFLKKNPWISNYMHGKEFCNVLQTATILGTIIYIEQLHGDRDYTAFHASMIEAIDPSMRPIYLPLLVDLSAHLLGKRLLLDRLPSYSEVLECDLEEIASLSASWCVYYMKGAAGFDNPDKALGKALLDVLCDQHFPDMIKELHKRNMLIKAHELSVGDHTRDTSYPKVT